MGFNLAYFFEELLDMIESDYSIKEIENYIKEQRQYAEECGKL